MLRSQYLSADQVAAIVHDYRTAGLTPAEVTMLAYAEKVTLHAYKVTPEDIETLRGHGFTDAEIFDIALVVGMRSLFSKALDAVGAEPDAAYLALGEALRGVLSVGRPFGEVDTGG